MNAKTTGLLFSVCIMLFCGRYSVHGQWGDYDYGYDDYDYYDDDDGYDDGDDSGDDDPYLYNYDDAIPLDEIDGKAARSWFTTDVHACKHSCEEEKATCKVSCNKFSAQGVSNWDTMNPTLCDEECESQEYACLKSRCKYYQETTYTPVTCDYCCGGCKISNDHVPEQPTCLGGYEPVLRTVRYSYKVGCFQEQRCTKFGYRQEYYMARKPDYCCENWKKEKFKQKDGGIVYKCVKSDD